MWDSQRAQELPPLLRPCSAARTQAWRLRHPERAKESGKKSARLWYLRHKEDIRGRRRFAKYGIAPEKFVALMNRCGKACEICGVKFSKKILPCLDHDHGCCDREGSCGECIRGLLCSNCNHVIGNAQDSKLILTKAIKYLRRKVICLKTL